MAPSLGTFPPEMLIQIVKNIRRTGHLLDLALCCRALHDLVLPELYTHLTLQRHEKRYEKLRLLTFRLLTNNSLASCVYSITLDEAWGVGCFLKNPPFSDNISDKDFMPTVAKHIKDWPETDREEWIELLERNTEDAMLALLLHTVLNLQIMHIVIPPSSTYTFTKLFKAAADKDPRYITAPRRLQNLRVIISSCDADMYGTSTELLYYYLQLPSICEIYVHNIGTGYLQDEKGFPLTCLKSGSCSTLEHLELRDSKLGAKMVKAMLATCSNLRTFVYELGRDHISCCKYSLTALRDALSANEATLENLWIDYWDDESYWAYNTAELTPISSLKDFKKLKNLRVGMYVFFGTGEEGDGSEGGQEEPPVNAPGLPDLASILPESLETLYFADTQWRVDTLITALWSLLSVKIVCMPKLKEIAFEAKIETGCSLLGDSMLSMENLASEVGVRVRVIESNEVFKHRDLGRGWDGSVKWVASMDNSGRFVARAERD
ncbi:MAG: hypothetical protein Q9182_006737 [Xanthomendoza sp. 2 TL-2023]